MIGLMYTLGAGRLGIGWAKRCQCVQTACCLAGLAGCETHHCSSYNGCQHASLHSCMQRTVPTCVHITTPSACKQTAHLTVDTQHTRCERTRDAVSHTKHPLTQAHAHLTSKSTHLPESISFFASSGDTVRRPFCCSTAKQSLHGGMNFSGVFTAVAAALQRTALALLLG
jgi:hypothetical protein